jgi:hypothetical protein
MDGSLFAFIFSDFWFHSETSRAEDEVQLRQADSENSFWLHVLAKEQLASITKYWFHGITFRLSCGGCGTITGATGCGNLVGGRRLENE